MRRMHKLQCVQRQEVGADLQRYLPCSIPVLEVGPGSRSSMKTAGLSNGELITVQTSRCRIISYRQCFYVIVGKGRHCRDYRLLLARQECCHAVVSQMVEAATPNPHVPIASMV